MTIRDAEEFIRLRTSEDPAEYRRAADEEAPLDVWQAIVAGHPDMRFWVAQNKTVPLEILRDLVDDDDAAVRSMVARKRRLDAASLRRLADDPDDAVREAVVRNPSATVDVLRHLLDDPWDRIRQLARDRLARVDDASL